MSDHYPFLPLESGHMMFFHAFAAAMFGTSIITLIVFVGRDQYIPATRASTRILVAGFLLSMLEASSGWLSCKALDDLNLSVFAPDTTSIALFAVLMTIGAGIATLRLHTAMMHRAGLSMVSRDNLT